jgi:hypothetical protein
MLINAVSYGNSVSEHFIKYILIVRLSQWSVFQFFITNMARNIQFLNLAIH